MVEKNICKTSLKNNPHSPIFAPAGLTRPAPTELPQGRKAARVGGCSGAM